MGKKEIIYHLSNYLHEKGVLRASLFGSFTKNENTENSDIDLLVELDKEKSLLDLIEIKLHLEELFSKKVDILTYDSINPIMRENILNTQEILFEKG